MAAGAVPAIVAALQAHDSAAAVAETACGFLCSIASFPAGKEVCVAAGAVHLLAAAFRIHAGEARQSAYEALKLLGYPEFAV